MSHAYRYRCQACFAREFTADKPEPEVYSIDPAPMTCDNCDAIAVHMLPPAARPA